MTDNHPPQSGGLPCVSEQEQQRPITQTPTASSPRCIPQEYVRARILAFNAQPALAQALGVTPSALHSATFAAAAAAPGPAARGRLALAFRHNCQHPGCAEAHCTLCRQSQSRKCGRTFAPKYLAADILKAACGAPIR